MVLQRVVSRLLANGGLLSSVDVPLARTLVVVLLLCVASLFVVDDDDGVVVIVVVRTAFSS
jgi:hypothetical protein